MNNSFDSDWSQKSVGFLRGIRFNVCWFIIRVCRP